MVIDKAASILARLRYKATSSGRSYQEQLQLFCQEEYLRRLYTSKYRESFILKGGLLLYIESGFSSRPTMDIDFLLNNMLNTLDSMTATFETILAVDTGNNYMAFTLLKVEQITEGRKYAGIRVKLLAQIANIRVPFHVDIGVGDVIIQKARETTMNTQPDLLVYPLESVIAEKFEAIISLMETSSRMKDYYDIFYLATNKVFDARVLQEAIQATFHHRGTYYTRTSLNEIHSFSENAKVTETWNLFSKRILKKNTDFRLVLDALYDLLSPIFDAIIHEDEFFGMWNPELRVYLPYDK